jgi:hypothetical protein
MMLVDAPLPKVGTHASWIQFWLDMREATDPEAKAWVQRAEKELKERGFNLNEILQSRDTAQKAWDESEHPRDDRGRFADAGGGDDEAPGGLSDVSISAGGGKVPSTSMVVSSAKTSIAKGSKDFKGKRLEGSEGHPGLISTAHTVGTRAGAKREINPTTYIRADLAQMHKDPKLTNYNIGLFKNLDIYAMRPSETKGDTATVERSVLDHMKANLRWLYETTPKAIRDRAAIWYAGGRNIIDAQIKKFDSKGLKDTTAAAVIAVFSPQKDWNQNVHIAQRMIDIYYNHRNAEWDDKMSKRAETLTKVSNKTTERGAIAKGLKAINGLKFSEVKVDDPKFSAEKNERMTAQLKGLWIRVYDEAHDARHYQIVSPEGVGIREATKGKPPNQEPATASWSGLSPLGQAIQVLESGGDRDKISMIMSSRHKVRSFYNNLLDPFSANGDTTADTHHVGAAWGNNGNDIAVLQSLKTSDVNKPEGFVPAHGSDVLGVHGTYVVYTEATRELAKELGISPNALQAIVWTAKRERFSNKNEAGVDAIWKRYQSGELSMQKAHDAIDKIAPMNKPEWA